MMQPVRGGMLVTLPLAPGQVLTIEEFFDVALACGHHRLRMHHPGTPLWRVMECLLCPPGSE